MIGQNKKIEQILSRFNFRKVMDVIQKNEFYWKDKEGDEYKPSQDEVERMALVILKDVAATKTSYCRVYHNGLVATKRQNALLELAYVVEAKWD